MSMLFRSAVALMLGLATAGCVPKGGQFGSLFAPARVQSSSVPAPNGEAIQYFAVPASGRAALGERLNALIGPGTPIEEARISNAWRTAASAAKTPNDYAACVSATTPRGVATWMIVVSGGGTGDAIGGRAGIQRCSDPSRVQTWQPFSDAIAMR